MRLTLLRTKHDSCSKGFCIIRNELLHLLLPCDAHETPGQMHGRRMGAAWARTWKRGDYSLGFMVE